MRLAMGMTAWIVVMLFGVTARVDAQATADAVAKAEDAFGSSEGDESVGIYDQTSVRGFNLESAGNYRINGRYFVKNSGVSSFFLEKTTIRIGYNALSLDYPGPSGVVDYTLRDPQRDEPSLLTLGVDSYEQPFAELHFKHRNAAETVAMSIGASGTSHLADEQGGDGRDALLAGTVRANFGRGRAQLFGGEYRYRRNGRFQVELEPEADSLPAEIERGRYLGQSWATEEGARRILGGLADLDLDAGWSLRTIGTFSQEAPDSQFTQLFSNVDEDALAQSSVIVSPEQRSHSYSGEVRLGKTFVTGQIAHSAAVTARLRDSQSRFGGEQFVSAGTTLLGDSAPPVARPDPRMSEANLRDSIEQRGLGITYQTLVRNRFKASGGVLYSYYAKRFTDAAGVVTSNESAPWLYNVGAALLIADGLELYGSYTRGLEEAGTAPSTAVNANAVLEATIVAQKELGLRYTLRPELTLIMAGFDTRKPQAGIHSATGHFDFLGDVAHRGIEASLAGSLTPSISAVVGAVYTDAEVSGPNVSARLDWKPTGRRPRLARHHQRQLSGNTAVELRRRRRIHRRARSPLRSERGGGRATRAARLDHRRYRRALSHGIRPVAADRPCSSTERVRHFRVAIGSGRDDRVLAAAIATRVADDGILICQRRYAMRSMSPSLSGLYLSLMLAAWLPLDDAHGGETKITSEHHPSFNHAPGRLVDVNDTKLWVETEGSGEPLLLLAGGPANSHLTFHPYFSALADEYRVIYVDYRGRGRSAPLAHPSEATFSGDVADIAALIEALGLQWVNLYGFSYGGMIAQALSLDHPTKVRRLILANTIHSPEMWQKNHENINREIELQYPEVWEQILALRAQGVRSTDPRVQALYRVHLKLVRFYNPDNAARLLTEPGSRNAELYPVFVGDDVESFIGGEVAKLPDFRPLLKALQMPVLILAGRYDRALYPKYQYEFTRYVPSAQFVWMERSGSFSHIEEPEAVLGMARGFLQDAPQAPKRILESR